MPSSVARRGVAGRRRRATVVGLALDVERAVHVEVDAELERLGLGAVARRASASRSHGLAARHGKPCR